MSLLPSVINKQVKLCLITRFLVVGLGKSIMIASLLHARSEPEPLEDSKASRKTQLTLDKSFRPKRSHQSSKDVGPSATLIVAPVSLLSQWRSELERSSHSGSLLPTLWHGASRGALNIDSGVDVVITSYGTLAAEFAKAHSPLYDSEPYPLIFSSWTQIAPQSSGSASCSMKPIISSPAGLRPQRPCMPCQRDVAGH